MLADKVCVITGGARGIGLETALEMARRGARVVADSDLAEAVHVASEIEAAGGESLALAYDVTSEDEITSALEAAGAPVWRH